MLAINTISGVFDSGFGESVQAENQRWHSPEEAAAEAAAEELP